jgi:hypothetical protein
MVAAIDGLPDVPITRFELAMNGGGVLLAARNLCQPPVPTLDATFTSHGGATRAVSQPVTLDGCAGVAGAASKPRVTATLSRVRSSRPSLVLKVAAGARRLRSFTVTLPKQLRAGTLRRASALAGGKALKRAVSGKKRTITLGKLPKAGSTTAELRLRKGALRRVSRIKAGSRVTIAVSVRDVTGKVTKVTVRALARR